MKKPTWYDIKAISTLVAVFAFLWYWADEQARLEDLRMIPCPDQPGFLCDPCGR